MLRHLFFNKQIGLIILLILVGKMIFSLFYQDANLDALESQLLSESQRKILSNIRYGFRYRLVDLNIEGKKRTVVLLGETHIKSLRSALLGKKILKHFNFRGLEGDKGRWYWVANSMRDSRLTHRPFNSEYRQMVWGSTIAEAMADGFLLMDNIISYNLHYMGEVKKIDDLTYLPEQTSICNKYAPEKFLKYTDLARYIISHNFQSEEGLAHNGKVSEEKFCIEFNDFNQFEYIANNIDRSKINIGLEKGSSEKNALFYWEDICLNGRNLFEVSFEWFQTCADSRLAQRDARMASNIIKAFKKFPEQNVMLVIVGAAHIKGIDNYLNTQTFDIQFSLPSLGRVPRKDFFYYY